MLRTKNKWGMVLYILGQLDFVLGQLKNRQKPCLNIRIGCLGCIGNKKMHSIFIYTLFLKLLTFEFPYLPQSLNTNQKRIFLGQLDNSMTLKPALNRI